MEVSNILDMVVSAWPVGLKVLQVLGSLVVVGLAVVAVTPSKKDDEFVSKGFLAKVLDAIKAFSPWQKK